MRKSLTFITIAIAVLASISFSACTRTKTVGNKPLMEFIVSGPNYIHKDTTLLQDVKYRIAVEAAKAEDESSLTTFEISRTYQGSADTTVFYKELTGEEISGFTHVHEFTTLKKAGTERYTFTVKNKYGVANQKIIIVTVK